MITMTTMTTTTVQPNWIWFEQVLMHPSGWLLCMCVFALLGFFFCLFLFLSSSWYYHSSYRSIKWNCTAIMRWLDYMVCWNAHLSFILFISINTIHTAMSEVKKTLFLSYAVHSSSLCYCKAVIISHDFFVSLSLWWLVGCVSAPVSPVQTY